MTVHDLVLITPFANALDAVTGPGGTPVCRIALTDPGTDCRPLNLFGWGRADPAAVDYVTADWNDLAETWLENTGVSINGEPFALWERPVSFAAGVVYREESFALSYDENALAGNFRTINGVNVPEIGNDVKEAFVEVAVPLLEDVPFAQAVNFNGAARVSDYSTGAGSIWSWKLGGTWRVTDGVKLRATRSRDIRAANLGELFSPDSTLFTGVLDTSMDPPLATNVVLFTGGNPNLEPEIADTLTVGGVFSPSFVPGLEFSIDYYDISIDDVITTLSAQQIVNSCYQQGNQNACAQITRGAGGLISEINATFINIAKYNSKGYDVEVSYKTPLDGIGLPGEIGVRALATYVDSLTVDNGIIVIDGVGYHGSYASFLVPEWRGTLTLDYESDRFGGDLRMRHIDSGSYAPPEILSNLGDNHIASRTYVDLNLRTYIPLGDYNLTVYGSVRNLFDREPPIAVGSTPYYDIIRRYYTLGIRANF